MPIFSNYNEIYDLLKNIKKEKKVNIDDYQCGDGNLNLDCHEGKLLKYILEELIHKTKESNDLINTNTTQLNGTKIIEKIDSIKQTIEQEITVLHLFH